MKMTSKTASPRWAKFKRYFTDTYLTVDARSLGFGRIVLALILLFDLVRRIPDITLFYSNQGLVPNHMMLWRPPTQWMFSFFFILSHPDEVAFAFVLVGIVYFLLLIGWRTRLMQVLSLICVLSLHGRVTLLENGGDWMLGELALWTAFLPLGRRFSVDALRASLRARREKTAAELGDRKAMDVSLSMTAVVSLAVLALALQVANSYIFNAAHKGGPTWRSGTAVHYVLHQDRMCTWFAVWMRPYMTLWLSRILSWGSLVTESILPVMLLAPFQKVSARRVAIVSIIGLHLGFQCFINLGVFSFAMIGYTPFLMTGADWEALARFAQRRKRRLAAYFDAGCGVCFRIVRVWARLDRLGRITFRSSADLASPTPETDADGGSGRRGVTPELLARTLVVVDEVTGTTYTRADAVAQVLRALPVGWLWSLPLRLPGLRALANWGYDLFARRRESISTWLGLAACAVPTPAVSAAPEESPAPAPAGSPASEPPPVVDAPPIADVAAIVLPSPAVVAPLAATASALAEAPLADAAGRIAAGRPGPAARGRSLRDAPAVRRAVSLADLDPARGRGAGDDHRDGQRDVVHQRGDTEVPQARAAAVDQTSGRLPAHDPGLVDVRVRRARERSDDGGRRRHRRRPPRQSLQRGHLPLREPGPRRDSGPSGQRFVRVQLLGAHPGSGSYHQALTEWILALPRAHRESERSHHQLRRLPGRRRQPAAIGEIKPRNVRSHVFATEPSPPASG